MKAFLKSRFSIKELIGIVLISMLLCFALMDYVNGASDHMLPKRLINVSAVESGNSVIVLRDGKRYDLFDSLFDNKSPNWDYEVGEEGISWSTVTIPSDGSSVQITVRESPRYYFLVRGNPSCAGLQFGFSDGSSITVDSFQYTNRDELVRVYPFQNDKTNLFVKTAIYAGLFIIIAIVLLLFDYLLKYKKNNCPILLKTYFVRPISVKDFFVYWSLLFLVAILIYKVIGIPNYLQMGDEYLYWNTHVVDSSGRWNSSGLAEFPSFRGYWSYIPSTIAKGMGHILDVDASIVYFLMPSAAISWLSTIILPGLYKILSGKDPLKIHIIPVIICMVTVWTDDLTCVGCDLMGVVFLFASFLYTVKLFRTEEWTSSIVAGLTGAIAISFRTANILGVVIIFVIELIRCLINQTRTKILSRLIIGLLSFLLVCLPQLQINLIQGHVGLLPYDSHDAWYG